MIGPEIVIGVIIGVFFELLSGTQGTPSEHRSDSNRGRVESAFRTIEIMNAARIAK